jgi:8-oxo-dGTP pyrophosphatase MutT (NUDIX family)
MIRELYEEVGITVVPEDLRIIHICHAFSPQETTPEVRQYFSFYFEVSSYTGTPTNAEPEKSEYISWIDWQKEEKI